MSLSIWGNVAQEAMERKKDEASEWLTPTTVAIHTIITDRVAQRIAERSDGYFRKYSPAVKRFKYNPI